jgi:hypothetical protein
MSLNKTPIEWVKNPDGTQGYKFTPEHRRRISVALTGRKLSQKHKDLISLSASKRILSEEHKLKIGDALRGEKHHNWKGGVTYPIFALRKTREYRHWRNAVLKRDNFQCTQCNKSKVRLHAHHIQSFTLFPELRFEVDNGITLCVPCHTKRENN